MSVRHPAAAGDVFAAAGISVASRPRQNQRAKRHHQPFVHADKLNGIDRLASLTHIQLGAYGEGIPVAEGAVAPG